MKLYTEEQLIEVVRLSLEDAEKSVIWAKDSYPLKLADTIIEKLTPIKLPSEEEIVNYSFEYENTNASHVHVFKGATWAINHIKQQNNGK